MKVYTLVNQKGGVGKTTLALLIALGLTLRGYRVLLGDGDPQGHTTLRLGYERQPGLYDLLVRSANWNQRGLIKIVPPEKYAIPGDPLPKKGKLYLLPGNIETMNIATTIEDSAQLAMRLEELEGKIDVAIFDTSPTPSLLHSTFYTATDEILFPTELAYTSIDGLVQSLKSREKSSKMRQSKWGLPPINVTGIIPMKYRKRVTEDQHHLATLTEHFGDKVWPTIGLRTIWKQAEAKACPVWGINPNCEAADEAWEIIDRVERSLNVSATK